MEFVVHGAAGASQLWRRAWSSGSRISREKSARAARSHAVSTVHEIACPPDMQDASVARFRSGLVYPLKVANTTPHLCGSWWWSR